MNLQEYKNRFEQYYNNVHNAWKECDDIKLMTMPNGNEAKAIKDAVGKWYEKYRCELLEEFGFEVNEQEKFYGWDADQVIRKDGKIVAIEDDKAQITTGESSVIITFMTIIGKILSEGKEVPYIILSSANRSAAWFKKVDEIKNIVDKNIVREFESKVKYFHATDKPRMRRDLYIYSPTNPFELSDNNINKELEFLNKLSGKTIGQ